MQLIQSFSPTSAMASTASSQDRAVAGSSDFDHLLSSISQPESHTEPTNKKAEDETTKEPAPVQDTSAQADNLLLMLLNTPGAVTTQPLPAQPEAQTPLPTDISQKTAPNLEAIAQSLAAELGNSENAMHSATPLPVTHADHNIHGMHILDSEKFQLPEISERKESVIDMPSAAPTHAAASKRDVDEVGAPSEPQSKSHVSTPFGQQGWDKAISQRVTWLLQDQLKSATLTLNPPHMGPIQVHVQMDKQQINVQFFAALPEVRQALQEAIPALESMMSQSGLQLGQSDVSDHQAPSQGQSSSFLTQKQGQLTEEADPLADSSIGTRQIGTGLLNTFA
jgi:flagellar hook-length control protein FliK